MDLFIDIVFQNSFRSMEPIKNLYSLKGFSSKFLIYKELFKTTLSKYSSIEEYLNKVMQLIN